MSYNATRIDGLSAVVEDQGWSEESLLGLALDFMNQKDLGPAFLEYLDERSASVCESVTPPGDSALAVAAVAKATGTGEEDWEFIDGPETGCGNEFWFEHSDGRTAYVCVDQGEVVTCTINSEGE